MFADGHVAEVDRMVTQGHELQAEVQTTGDDS